MHFIRKLSTSGIGVKNHLPYLLLSNGIVGLLWLRYGHGHSRPWRPHRGVASRSGSRRQILMEKLSDGAPALTGPHVAASVPVDSGLRGKREWKGNSQVTFTVIHSSVMVSQDDVKPCGDGYMATGAGGGYHWRHSVTNLHAVAWV